MKKILMSAALTCGMIIGAQAQEVAEVKNETVVKDAVELKDTIEQKVTVVVDTLKAKADLEEYYKTNPSYDKTQEKGKAAGKAIKEAARATKHKVIDGEENTGAGEAFKEAAKATGETVVEATKNTGRYIKKQTPVVADSIKAKSKRLKEKFKNW